MVLQPCSQIVQIIFRYEIAFVHQNEVCRQKLPFDRFTDEVVRRLVSDRFAIGRNKGPVRKLTPKPY
jgi:hypothetical protein